MALKAKTKKRPGNGDVKDTYRSSHLPKEAARNLIR
jgi:hypothetical protein